MILEWGHSLRVGSLALSAYMWPSSSLFRSWGIPSANLADLAVFSEDTDAAVEADLFPVVLVEG